MSLTLSNQKNRYNALVLTEKRKIMFLSNLGTFIFQEGMNNIIFYKWLIHCHGKSYTFLINIKKSNDSAWLLAKFIADEVYL